MSAIPTDTDVNINAAEQNGAVGVRVVQIWDLPLRIFHWTLVVSIVAAYVTAEFGGSEWAGRHGWVGSLVLALLVFRVIWGFIGTEHARFFNFVPTPARVADYLRGRWQGAGHNPLGALSVIALLLLVAAQVITGLFANDDIAFAGPLSAGIGKSTSDWLTDWHQQIFYVLAGFIGLHLLAVLFYLVIRQSNLVSPMITGNKAIALGAAVTAPRHLIWRFVAAVTIAATVSWSVFQDSASVHAVAAPPAATADW